MTFAVPATSVLAKSVWLAVTWYGKNGAGRATTAQSGAVNDTLRSCRSASARTRAIKG